MALQLIILYNHFEIEEAVMQFRDDARPSPIAGSWYPGDPVKLAAEIDIYLERAKVSEDEYKGKVLGLVAPHAGHRYSGATAAYAYKLVMGNPRKLAVILSTFHQYSSAEFLTTAHSAYRTPLGDIAVEKDLLSQLDTKMKIDGLELDQLVQDGEHSLEIQLPFSNVPGQSHFSYCP